MGTIYSIQGTQYCLATFDNGNVFVGQNSTAYGTYHLDKVYDKNGCIIATVSGGALFPTAKAEGVFTVKDTYIYRNNTPYVKYDGDAEGACAAAYLLYKNHTITTNQQVYWSFHDLWENIYGKSSTFVKVLIVLGLILIAYWVLQLPALAAILLKQDVGLIMICLWAGAFLFGFKKKAHPVLREMRDVFSFLWDLLIPYLHAIWISFAVSCIYALVDGYFSLSFFSSSLYAFPQTVLCLTAPLYMVHLIRLLFLLYVHKPK